MTRNRPLIVHLSGISAIHLRATGMRQDRSRTEAKQRIGEITVRRRGPRLSSQRQSALRKSAMHQERVVALHRHHLQPFVFAVWKCSCGENSAPVQAHDGSKVAASAEII